jgi:Transposase zinc-binding domain
LEVADIFRDHGAAWRSANAGHVSLDQLKVMSAIERCRTVALGGHVARCENCANTVIAYNSCRNRHCPKCQGATAKEWLAEREAELLPVGYFHLSSRCRVRSPTSPTRTKPRSMVCCSRRRLRPC